MFNHRQKQLIQLLVETREPISTGALARMLNCSEKTVRTDLKLINEWLETFESADLIRKPGTGVVLNADEPTKETMKAAIEHSGQADDNDPETRVLQASKRLLESETYTLQQLADALYVSKATMRHDIQAVQDKLSGLNLRLIRKPRVGLQVRGKEQDWRQALAQIIHQLNQRSQVALIWHQAGMKGLLPQQEMLVIERFIRKLESALPYNFTDEAIMNLMVHIGIAARRVKRGHQINMAFEELKRLRTYDEFALAERFANHLEKLLAMVLPESEVGYITLHLIGAKIQGHEELSHRAFAQAFSKIDPDALKAADLVVDCLEDFIGVSSKNDQHLRHGLIMHLHSALNRLKYGLTLHNPLLEQIKANYRYSFELIHFILPELEQCFDVTIPEDEAAYLSLHIQAALERISEHDQRYRALIACSTGMGTSNLIQAKLNRSFPQIDVIDTVSVNDITRTVHYSRPDFVISTVPVELQNYPVVTITPVLSETDQNKISRFLTGPLEQGSQPTPRYHVIGRLLNKDLIFIHPKTEHRFALIEAMGHALYQGGYVSQNYSESAVKRDYRADTALSNGLAIPHGSPSFIYETAIALAVLDEPMPWGESQVQIVLILALGDMGKEETEVLFKELAALEDDLPLLETLKTQTDPNAVLKQFKS
ncbi:BglG family transcription antiterminator [Tuberibacillus sp. Marseille-P3662]|uniref:BglG family transcription antiterminator n=1 Tax=Tuberibacillus sp. Marseille-P3662 TaxID=1965358 RepID=UPI001593E6CE|nr:BglG family transcription antiterminator [Tuberibacillus sp. Marseille-P3662]